MGLGSKDNIARKEFKAIAGKNDWKAKVLTPAEATISIDKIKSCLPKDPKGQLIICAYVTQKIQMLEAYVREADEGQTLKQYLDGKKC